MAIWIGAVRMQTAAVGAVFVVACSGLITAGTVRDIRRWAASGAPTDVGAVLMDYRSCAVAITEGELIDLAATQEPPSPSTPLAWLLRDEETAAVWRRQALRLALASGQRRYASSVQAAAFAWATEQARLGRVAAPR